MNKYILWIIVAIFPFASYPDAKNMKVLDQAYMQALEKKYQDAISKTSRLLDALVLNKIEEIVLAHQILSISYCETGNREKALEHYQALRAFSPNEDFRAFNPSPTCKTLLTTPTTKNPKRKNKLNP